MERRSLNNCYIRYSRYKYFYRQVVLTKNEVDNAMVLVSDDVKDFELDERDYF
jgi:hypothetical protein